MSALVNNFCTLADRTECNRMFCHLMLFKIMNAIQPFRGQESLYKLYKNSCSPGRVGRILWTVCEMVFCMNQLRACYALCTCYSTCTLLLRQRQALYYVQNASYCLFHSHAQVIMSYWLTEVNRSIEWSHRGEHCFASTTLDWFTFWPIMEELYNYVVWSSKISLKLVKFSFHFSYLTLCTIFTAAFFREPH